MHVRHGHNIPVVLLRSFISISGHGSFTKAAEELNLTQPAISAQIKRLQRMVGGDLFFKKAQGVGLTELGSMVEIYARRILALNDQIIAIAGHAPKHETVNLGIQNMFAGHVLVDVVSQVPQTGHYRFVCASAPVLAEKLKAGYVDLVFMLSRSESRRNIIAEWNEPIVWGRAPEMFPVVDNEADPLYPAAVRGLHRPRSDGCARRARRALQDRFQRRRSERVDRRRRSRHRRDGGSKTRVATIADRRA